MERILLISALPIYVLASGLYGIGLLKRVESVRRAGIALYLAGAALNLSASVHRGVVAGHFPFSNMFETMMTLGGSMVFLFAFSEFGMKSKTGWIDSLLAAIMIVPCIFFFEDRIKPIPPALQSHLFFPHVATYLISYAALAKAAILSGMVLVLRLASSPDEHRWVGLERTAYRMSAVGFPMLTAGLLLGAVWAARAWGAWWGWDPKEVWALNTWILYLMYFHIRVMNRGKTFWSDLFNLLGFVAVIVTLFVVNLSKIFGGLHAYA